MRAGARPTSVYILVAMLAASATGRFFDVGRPAFLGAEAPVRPMKRLISVAAGVVVLAVLA